MPAYEFNLRYIGQFFRIEKTHGLHVEKSFTFEALITPLAQTEDATIFSRPIGKRWEPPYIAYRLGFTGGNLVPEFQILFEGEHTPLTVRGIDPLPIGQATHVAGTYDGINLRLFVNGKLINQFQKVGRAVKSSEPATFGSRSSSDPGGYFVGLMHELRAWKVARTEDEINQWKFRVFPIPAPPDCQGLWQSDRSLPRDHALELASLGFTELEIAWANFVGRYTLDYNRLAPKVLHGKAAELFAEPIGFQLLIRAKDGYLAIYEPNQPTYIKTTTPDVEGPPQPGCFLYDHSQYPLSEILQTLTRNTIKIAYPTIGKPATEAFVSPIDLPDTVAGGMLAPAFRESKSQLPRVTITPNVLVKDGIVTGLQSGRIHIAAPLLNKDGTVSRLFSAPFIDLWIGELNWDVTAVSLAEALAISDLAGLDILATPPLLPDSTVSIRPVDPTAAVEAILVEFERLLDKPDVDEVKDIQPFLAEPKRWFLLSPSCKNVWPQKMLGNKFRVDFVVQEATDTYVAIEIESPTKQLYKSGKAGAPYAEFTQAEQQVRDYCNYIDMNRDSVEREEDLAGIFKPRGLVVIGRRRDLSVDAARKLRERNADEGRYKIIVYDDLIDQARQTIARLKLLMS